VSLLSLTWNSTHRRRILGRTVLDEVSRLGSLAAPAALRRETDEVFGVDRATRRVS
jgi:hypothetical protein